MDITKLAMRGVTIRYIDVRSKQAGSVARVHCSADLTDELREHMEWPSFDSDVESSLESANLVGILRLSSVQFNPNSMNQHAIDIAALELSNFRFSWVKEEDDVAKSEIRFRLMLESQDSIIKMVGYFLAVGGVDAAMKCSLAAAQAPIFPADTAKEEEEDSIYPLALELADSGDEPEPKKRMGRGK